MKITSGFLREHNTWEDEALTFESEWPDGAEVTLDNMLRAAELGLNVGWIASHLLHGPDRARYRLATEPAYEEYDRALSGIEEAYRDYDVYIAAASSIYDITDSKGMIARCEACFMQLDAAHQALKKARAPYRVSLHRKLAHALVEVLEDLEDAQAAREAVQAYRAGETVPWEQAKAELVGCCANPHPATAAPVCETAALAEPPWR